MDDNDTKQKQKKQICDMGIGDIRKEMYARLIRVVPRSHLLASHQQPTREIGIRKIGMLGMSCWWWRGT